MDLYQEQVKRYIEKPVKRPKKIKILKNALSSLLLIAIGVGRLRWA